MDIKGIVKKEEKKGFLERIKSKIVKKEENDYFDISVARDKSYNLDNLYFGYLGIIRKIDEDKFRFEQLSNNPIAVAYKDEIETVEYYDNILLKRESFKDCFNNRKYYSYFSDFTKINDGELVFAPLLLLSYYLPIKNRIENKIDIFELYDILEYFNNFLSKINFNVEFDEPYKNKKGPFKIVWPDKVEFKTKKTSNDDVVTDVKYQKVLEKHNITEIKSI